MSDMARRSRIRIIADICLRRWSGVRRICLTFGYCRSIAPPVLLFRRLGTKCVKPDPRNRSDLQDCCVWFIMPALNREQILR
jgi:hypothetical protein